MEGGEGLNEALVEIDGHLAFNRGTRRAQWWDQLRVQEINGSRAMGYQ